MKVMTKLKEGSEKEIGVRNGADVIIDVKILDHGKDLDLPQYATEGSAGLDLKAAIDEAIVIRPMERKLVPTGLSMAIPEGYEAQIRPRSGLAFKKGITVLNTPGTIDSDYRGEVKVLLINFGTEDFLVEKGMRIAQLVVKKYEKIEWNEVESLDDTSRAGGGYGSTGIK